MGGISFDPQSSNSWTDIFSSSNYLFNGETTWTMTPIMFANGRVGRVMATGNYGTSLHSTLAAKFNLRPVINLRSDTKFTFNGTGEKGTLENPYIVS